jgi:diguanylate cyclase (GGDEF)-like protein
MPHTDLDAVQVVAERVRAAIAGAVLPAPFSDQHVTASIGLAILRDGDTAMLLREADMALYTAKANGRNRVEGGTEALRERSAATLVHQSAN